MIISYFIKNVSTLVVFTIATSLPLDTILVNLLKTLISAASSYAIVYNLSSSPYIISPLRTFSFLIITSQLKLYLI